MEPRKAVVWLTGAPASGKSTVARALRAHLDAQRVACCVLDGDEVRAMLRPSPGYDSASRVAFYETLADLAAMLAAQGLLVIVAATSHLRAHRDYARRVAPRFIEVHVRCEPETCEARDPKGLYARARAGEIAHLPTVGVAYEAPLRPDIVIDTTHAGPDRSAAAIADALRAA